MKCLCFYFVVKTKTVPVIKDLGQQDTNRGNRDLQLFLRMPNYVGNSVSAEPIIINDQLCTHRYHPEGLNLQVLTPADKFKLIVSSWRSARSSSLTEVRVSCVSHLCVSPPRITVRTLPVSVCKTGKQGWTDTRAHSEFITKKNKKNMRKGESGSQIKDTSHS